MKKVLALVLTLAMLLSSMAVGLSAAQVVTKNEKVNHYGYAESNGVAAGWGIDKVFSLDMLIEKGADGITGYGIDGWDSITVTTDKIGVGNDKFDSGIKEDTWYNVKFDASAGNGTDIYVNGALVGHANSAIGQGDRRACSGWYGVKFDNVRVLDENGNAHVEDFEDGVFNVKDHQCCSLFKVLDETVATYSNENVYEYADSNKYLEYDPEVSACFDIRANQKGGLSSGSEFTLKFDARFNGADAFTSAWINAPVIKADGTVGVDGVTAKAVVQEPQENAGTEVEFEVGRWYTFVFYTNGAATLVFVDNVHVATIAKGLDKDSWYGQVHRISLDNIVVWSGNAIANGFTDNPEWTEDFQDGKFDRNGGDSSGVVTSDIHTVRNDLGLWYGYAESNGVAAGWGIDKIFSLDMLIEKGAGGITGYGIDGWDSITVTTEKIGVGNETFASGMKEDVWYNVKFDASAGNGTDIYVNGAFIGHTNYTIGQGDRRACSGWYGVKFDNVRVLDENERVHVEDFEDGVFNVKDHQCCSIFKVVDYVIEEDSIFKHFETKEVGGEALLFDQAPEYGTDDMSTYIYDSDYFKVGNDGFIMNFDLSILPNNNTSVGSCFEIWTSGTGDANMNRWKIGVMPVDGELKGFYGAEYDSTKDYRTFDWGEATKDTFHNITYYMDFAHRVGQIYIDGQLVYEGNSGASSHWGNIISMPHNASVIMDNIQLMNLDYEPINTSIYPSSFTKTVNLDAEDFCAANGHVSGKLERTAQPKCYEEGTDTFYCAVCGAVKSTASVAKVAHKWESYDISRKNSQGLVTVSCKNSGCKEVRYTTVPEAGTYTGTLQEYYDMSDDMVLVVDNSWGSDTWKVVESDGRNVLRFGAGKGDKPHENNYNYFSPNAGVRADNWSWNLDIVYNGTPWYIPGGCDRYENGRPGYGHVLYFWVGGETGTNAIVGYNADVNKLYLTPNASGPNQDDPTPVGAFGESVDFTMVEGEKYNIQVSVSYHLRPDLDERAAEDEDLWDDPDFLAEYATQFASLKLFVNGVEYIDWHYTMYLDEDDMLCDDGSISALTYVPSAGRTSPLMVLRNFGMSIDVLDMAVGTADFAYTNRTYVGDVDGDNQLTAADALAMRKYLARVFGDSDIQTSRADANADGVLNAKDQLVIRKALAQ